jgi:multiple sugar transport system ATP-binding protein
LASVKLVGLTKRFENVVAVNRVSLEVVDGELLVLLGPSGCGKTTVLRCIAGLETPDEGEIYIDDDCVNELPPKDRDVAMVFQSYALYPHMRVYDNLAFPLKIRKYPKSEIDKMVKEVAELLKIENLLNRKPKQLSGGEAQRVALGRAIIRNPKVFLMDEPLSNLDAKLRLYMRAELKRLQKDLGITTIYVTHDQAEAMTMGDRIAVMNYGTIQQLGSPDEIYGKPANSFVAGFIGSPPMNFLEAKIAQFNDKYILEGETFKLEIPTVLGKAIVESISDPEVIVGFRPEEIKIHNRWVANSIEAELLVYEPLGSEVIVDLKVGMAILKARAPPNFRAELGCKLWITIPVEKLYVFDKLSGKAVLI